MATSLTNCVHRYHYQIWQDVQAGKQRMERGTADQPDLEVVIEDQNAVGGYLGRLPGYNSSCFSITC